MSAESPPPSDGLDGHVRSEGAIADPGPSDCSADGARSDAEHRDATAETYRSRTEELDGLNQELRAANERLTLLHAELLAELEATNRGVVALYSEEHQLALTLQRTFLPETLPRSPGIDLAVRYLAAAGHTEIGGDFYEALHTPAGLLLAVGDVAGHSLKAAVVMGQVRHALRAYATEGHGPHAIVERLDDLMVRHHPTWTATVCVVLVDPDHTGMHVANAGHLPPLVIPPDGRPTYAEDHGPLLGVGLPHPPSTYLPITPGTGVLMVTDGLIEVRGADMRDRLDALARVVQDGPADCESLCDTLVRAFTPGQEDDVVVLAARLGHSPESVAAATAGPATPAPDL